MKKALSIILSLIMIASVFALPVSAEDAVTIPAAECDCDNHVTDKLCTCCLYCDNLDGKYVTSCVREVEIELEDGTKELCYTVCCTDCNGIFPCDCLCDCCDKNAEDTPEIPGKPPILTPDQQDKVISSFQEIMQKVVEFFNEFFNYIFEFLKFTDIMNPGKTEPTE